MDIIEIGRSLSHWRERIMRKCVGLVVISICSILCIRRRWIISILWCHDRVATISLLRLSLRLMLLVLLVVLRLALMRW